MKNSEVKSTKVVVIDAEICFFLVLLIMNKEKCSCKGH